jgi:hypothetical protein
MVPHHFGDFRHAHGGTGVAGIGFLHSIHGKDADRVREVFTSCHSLFPFSAKGYSNLRLLLTIRIKGNNRFLLFQEFFL